MRNITKEWRDLHQARKMMRNIKEELKQLDKMMVKAQQEICQPKHSYYD